jgi:hypothetical protein
MDEVKGKTPDGDNLEQKPIADSGKAGFLDDLPEPLRKSPSLAKFNGKTALAQSYVELEGQLGKYNNSVILPEKDAKPEELEKFYSRIGRPEKKDDYKLDPTEGFEAPEEYLNSMKSLYHEAGLRPEQASIIHKKTALAAASIIAEMKKIQEGNVKKSEGAAKLEREQAEATLRTQWGLNYDLRIEQARRFIIDEGGADAIDYLEKKGVASDPVILRLMAKAGASIAPHKLVSGPQAKDKPGSPYDYMRTQ